MITQIYYGTILRGNSYRPAHGPRLQQKLGLKSYRNRTDGTLFYGCYSPGEYGVILNHKGQGVILWGGSDITKALKNKWKFPQRFKHITFTNHNQAELKRIGIKSTVKQITFLDPSTFPIYPLGNSVFCYVPYKMDKFYGIKKIKLIAKELPNINFIIARYGKKKKPFPNCSTYSLLNIQGMIKLYKASFCSIRPTRHDGFPQSIAELGLMGRNTGWTYKSNVSTQCRSIDDYVKFIQNEKRRLIPDMETRKKVLKISNATDNILDGF